MAASPPELRRTALPKQQLVQSFYSSTPVQVGVALIIGANFLTNIIEKQIDPYGDEHTTVFGIFGIIYNVLFTIELGVNIYGHWWCEFWKSGWNVFDAVVVTIGIVNMLKLPLPAAFSMLRMMRAFRVFRLFKRVKSLNKIIVAIMHAVPGVLNAFLILAIVMSIYAILAVEFYQNVGLDEEVGVGGVITEKCRTNWITMRGICAGQEYFGTFSKSLYSFFQVLTGESWSEAVARPVIWFYIDSPAHAVGSALFFVSYVVIGGIVLTNVVVAVLLDKMVDPEVAESADEMADDGNGEEKPDDIIAAEEMTQINVQVKQLSCFSGNMKTDLDTARKEMVSLREQIDTVLRLVQKDQLT